MTAGATGGDTLLNIPPCSMAEGPGEQSQSLFRPPMSDPEMDLEHQRGARPKSNRVTGNPKLKSRKLKQSPQRSRHSRCGEQIFIYHWEANPGFLKESLGGHPLWTEQGNPGIYVQIDEWLPLYKGNIYVVDEVTGRMYLAKGEHLMWIAETASHRPFQDHELSMSRHIPEREYIDQGGQEPTFGTKT